MVPQAGDGEVVVRVYSTVVIAAGLWSNSHDDGDPAARNMGPSTSSLNGVIRLVQYYLSARGWYGLQRAHLFPASSPESVCVVVHDAFTEGFDRSMSPYHVAVQRRKSPRVCHIRYIHLLLRSYPSSLLRLTRVPRITILTTFTCRNGKRIMLM